MYTVFSTAYWIFIALMCVPLFLGALLIFGLTALFDRRRVILHLYSSMWAALYLRANPMWHARINGRQRLPWKGAAVIVANHASLIDILVLFSLFRPFKWVSKASVFKVPFLGWNMTLNDYVPLVRGDRESIVKMMAHCRHHLDRGVPVMIFPEGTRSETGELRPFKEGAFRLAKEAGCPLIPIAVSGTGHALPKHGFVVREPMHARVEVLEALDPKQFDSVEALRDAARDAIVKCLASQKEELQPAR